MATTPRKASSTVKAFVVQVQTALGASTRPTPTLHGIDCSRLWVQGVVVACNGDATECVVDDGTGIAVVDMKVFLKSTPPGLAKQPSKGDYVMVIGPLQKKLMQQQLTQTQATANDDVHASAPLRILAHQVVLLDAKEQREAVWFLEVIEYWTSVVQQQHTDSSTVG